MSGVKTLIPAQNTPFLPNKDLSCLRCRKKKAKCSKTQPTCTRCARSNQSCEYPDAPPNLTDLSQKVLNLYDTLRELEGEFLGRMMQSGNDQDTDMDEILDISPALTPPLELQGSELLPVPHPLSPSTMPVHVEDKERESTPSSTPPVERSDWSLSLTPSGLSLQASTCTLADFSEFANKLAHQLCRDFGRGYLPPGWDEEEDTYDDDELDETDYLVTVPVCSLSSLLSPSNALSTTSPSPTLDGTLESLFQSHRAAIFSHLQSRRTTHEFNTDDIVDLAELLHTLVDSLLSKANPNHITHEPLTRLCIYTAFIVSAALLPPLPDAPIPCLAPAKWVKYAEETTTQLLDLALAPTDPEGALSIALCTILLSWVDVELSAGTKATALLHFATRILCASSDRRRDATTSYQHAWAAIVYLDVSMTAFHPRDHVGAPPLGLEGGRLREWISGNTRLGVRLMSLLHTIVSLFYTADTDPARAARVHKVDVDDVLTLVRDLEQWEQGLPASAAWTAVSGHGGTATQLHLMHNIIKVLLYRPFCTGGPLDADSVTDDPDGPHDQTYTRTTFIELSMQAADRLATCVGLAPTRATDRTSLCWREASRRLIDDVCERAHATFGNDEHVAVELEAIRSKLPLDQPSTE